MFERLAEPARAAVTEAGAHASRNGSDRIDCDHLLLGLLAERSGPVAEALQAAGIQPARLRELLQSEPAAADPLDAAALASLGINLDEVRRAADATFGAGALDRVRLRHRGRTRFTAQAAKAIECALRVTVRQRQRRIGTGQLLAGILYQADNPAVRAIADSGADPVALRADVLRRVHTAA